MDRRGGALPANTTDGRRSDHDSRTASALPRRDIFVFGLCKSDDNAESVGSMPYRRYSITRNSPL
jgi:hypothetical protein